MSSVACDPPLACEETVWAPSSVGHTVVQLSKSICLDTPQLGLMMVINLGSGLYAPPVGTRLAISSSMGNCYSNGRACARAEQQHNAS